MMSTTSKSGFRKIRRLITILKKCNGKAVPGDSGALISSGAAEIMANGVLVLLAGAIFAGSYYVQPFLEGFIGLRELAQALMLLLLVMSFVLSVKDIVTVLYAADDLAQLLPMPFSAGQIVMAKVAVAASFPVKLSLIVLNGVCLGYGIRGGAGAPFIIGTVLSSILIPATGICAATLLVVIVFRVFGFIRNRDIMVALGGIFTFALSFAYIFINNTQRQGDAGEAAAAALGMFSSVSAAVPNISFMNRFMFSGSLPGLLISLAVTAALFAAALLAVKAFYFDTALSMRNTGSSNKAVSRALLSKGRKNDMLGALTVHEAKSTRRNPAYLIYGFAMSFLWPVLVALPLFLRNGSLLGGLTAPLGTTAALLGSVSLALTASCFSCGFNVLPGSAFSREGGSLALIRSLPVDFADYYRSKRNFSLLICSLGSVLYVVILGIVCVAAGIISPADSWTVFAGAGAGFCLNVILIDLMLLRDSRKPRLNWDSETEISRKLGLINIIAIIAGVLLITVFMLSVFMLPMLDDSSVMTIAFASCAGVVGLLIVLALVINHFAVQKGAGNLMKLE